MYGSPAILLQRLQTGKASTHAHTLLDRQAIIKWNKQKAYVGLHMLHRLAQETL